MARRFLLLQPDYDPTMWAADVDTPESRKWFVDRGVPESFLNEAKIGDFCMMDRERVVIRVGEGWDEREWGE